MKKQFFYKLGFGLLTAIVFQTSQGQNTSPYWSLAGNSNASSSSKLGTTNKIPLRLMTNNTTRIYISPSVGNVGIGTTNPASKLEVYNGALTVTSTTSSAILVLNRANAIAGTSNQILFKDNGAVKWAFGGTNIGSGGAGNFSLYNYTLGLNALTISNSTNNIGIGTTAPEAKLHVVGSGIGIIGTSADIGLQGNSTSGSYGVQGNSSYLGVYGIGGSYGTYGYSNNSGYGVYGVSSTSYSSNGSTGVYGNGYYGLQGKGVFGVYAVGDPYGVQGYSVSTFGYGVQGLSTNYIGVYGKGGKYGLYGYGDSYGVYGEAGSNGYAGLFNGNVYCSGAYLPSDRKLKKNITDFTSAMDIIGRLQPKSYEYRQDGNFKFMNLPEGKHYGLIAQDLEQVFPSLVKETKFDARFVQESKSKQEPGKAPMAVTEQQFETIDFKAVNYTELIPILIKGMQEQQQQLEELRKENTDIKRQLAELKAPITANTSNNPSVNVSFASLEQNAPNPADGITTIRYHIPEIVTLAILNISNAKGEIVKTIPINNRGLGHVNLNSSMLAAGTYNYTLSVDGKQVDSKRLVIVR